MGHKGEIIHNSYSSNNDFAYTFSGFFTRKPATVRGTSINNSRSVNDTIVMDADVKFEGQPLTHSKAATQDEVRAVISELDQLPTSLLRNVLEWYM